MEPSVTTRITRSRAAKMNEPPPAKKRTREEDAAEAPMPRTRGRPKSTKTSEPETASSASTSKKTTTTTTTRAPRAAAAAAAAKTEPAPAPAKRGRPRKNMGAATAEDDKKKSTVAAASSSTRSTASTRNRAVAATKSSIQKTVTFEEPDEKENIPLAKGKAAAKPATGLRAKPVRKAATTTRTRGTAKTAGETEKEKAMPLSPKKITQMRVRQEDPLSDDELALNEPSPLKKSPIKAAIFHGASSKAENSYSNNPTASSADGENKDAITTEPFNALASPARRPPSSPFRESMKSPAKRVEGMSLPPPSTMKDNQQAGGVTPFKASLLQSPAKRLPSAMKSTLGSSLAGGDTTQTPFKMSLLQSPARRPMSTFKGFASVRKEAENTGSPVTRAAILSTPTLHSKPSDMLMDCAEAGAETTQQNPFSGLPPSLQFPGRLSAVLPRDADPALTQMVTVEEEMSENDIDLVNFDTRNVESSHNAIQPPESGKMVISQAATTRDGEDEDQEMSDPEEAAKGEGEGHDAQDEPPSPTDSTTPPDSPPRSLGMFGLREKDLNPFHDLYEDSEDELANSGPSTPTPGANGRTPMSRVSRLPRASNFGFTPLAAQLNAWSATSPVKANGQHGLALAQSPSQQPGNSNFFNDEMMMRDDQDLNAEIEAAIEADINAQVGEPVFDDMLVTEEDMALASEANEMSLMEPEELADIGAFPEHDDSVSDASQDYGDENQVPIDPVLLAQSASVPPVTPARVLTREFHTVSKVPLKPADDSTPRPSPKVARSYSVSRISPSKRPTTLLSRNATVISYSPTKGRGGGGGRRRRETQSAQPPPPTEQDEEEEEAAIPATPTPAQAAASAPSTPMTTSGGDAQSADLWSTLGTPNRTPRRDLDTSLLRGAVVYVDVHTSEGADASGIFVELLGQMGARCVKTWSWTGNESSRIGITHVVYKDGGKRTLEKVRDSHGVVQCVGVSWVLDCERENKWLEEAPYYIDTSLVPRGGGRRRKSMEPKALANLNGTLVSGPIKQGGSQTAPSTPAFNRRDSYAWMRTSPDQQQQQEDAGSGGAGADAGWGVDDDDECMLTPVPRTPAPEDIRRYAENIVPETPTMALNMGDVDESDFGLAARTCPPKQNPFRDMGAGILSPEKDQAVMMRLMAARRKSLQFAPKVGSPLSRTWE